ncbi:sugar transferase [Spirosoma rhododendri]|nr:sugar transferase [Spirosoma rhododendri]
MSPYLERTMHTAFRVLYVDDSYAQISALRCLLHNEVKLSVAESAADALHQLTESYFIDLVVINETTMGRQLLDIINLCRMEQGFATMLLVDESTTDFNVQERGQPTVDIFPVDFDPDIVQKRVRYFIQKKAYRSQQPISDDLTKSTIPFGKRLFDIVLSATILLALTPLMLVVTLLIRLDSRGPIFYKSRRIGMGYRPFFMYKFRTMRTGADSMIQSMASQNMYSKARPAESRSEDRCERCLLQGSACQNPLFQDGKQVCERQYLDEQRNQATFMKFKADPRVTRLGKFLRNASIDELPQLVNILRGDMSFVGNRPLPPYEAEKLTQDDRVQRFAAPAGLTGLWQVTKRGRAGVSDQERMDLDAEYAQTYSLKTDLMILIRTSWALFQKENV